LSVKRGKVTVDAAKAPGFGQFGVLQNTFEVKPTIFCGYKDYINVPIFQ